MMSRRGVVGAGAAVAAMLLSSCGIGRKDLGELTTAAASEVEGISSVELEAAGGANFERILRGTITLAAPDRSSALGAFDEAMRQIVTVIHGQGDAETDRTVRVGGVVGLLPDGGELDALDLDPDMPTADPRLDRVTAGSFYEKYELG